MSNDNDITTTSEDALRKVVPETISPAAVAEAMEDPEVFEQIARGDLYVQLMHLRRIANSNTFNVSHRLEYVKMLSRMGKVDKPDPTLNPLAGLPMINIVLPGSGQNLQVGAANQDQTSILEHEDA